MNIGKSIIQLIPIALRKKINNGIQARYAKFYTRLG